MCRLFGYVSHERTSPVKELGEEDFEEFTSLTRVHSDGWGMAWRDPETKRIEVRRSPLRADNDPEYAKLSTQLHSKAGFVHLRWATGNLAITQENTHPFLDDNMAFAHNGNIEPISQLEELLTADSMSRLRGATDSERYFQLIRQCVEATGDERQGVTQALRILMHHFPNASLNALLLTSTHLFAIHVNSRADSPQDKVRALFESPDAVPARHGNEYYAMDYRHDSSGFTVISSGITRTGWTAAATDAAAIIDLETRERERLDLIG
ncbi:class II glutamine amidotransferase [Leucobacter denitrificans]|uniref:Class II glutamine amidotransferase n=1 Tax=Leucobacter denitrificans TaxID=683042 RepID=A0A7G9S490_9MICO|nr:class II glutamine amidotransferase [Leucobacter denitrificans]QNN62665.1 class II glutamine amidotransferase [Leucobacter denitrificans]